MGKVSLNDYQKAAIESCFNSAAINQHAIRLAGEGLKVVNKVKTIERFEDGDYTKDETKRELAENIGEVIKYCAALSHDLGYDLEDVVQICYDKMQTQKHNEGSNE